MTNRKEYFKRWREKHKGYMTEYMRKWRKNPLNLDKEHKQNKKNYPKNKPKRKIYENKWRKKNPGKAKYLQYRYRAKKNNKEFTLTKEQFEKLIIGKCYYCGDRNRIGVDRKDNLKGYTPENSVSCCRKCNYMKFVMNKKEFLKQCQKIVNYRG